MWIPHVSVELVDSRHRFELFRRLVFVDVLNEALQFVREENQPPGRSARSICLKRAFIMCADSLVLRGRCR